MFLVAKEEKSNKKKKRERRGFCKKKKERRKKEGYKKSYLFEKKMHLGYGLQTHAQAVTPMNTLLANSSDQDTKEDPFFYECLARGVGDPTARNIMEYIGDDPHLHLELTRRIFADILHASSPCYQSFSFNAGNELLQSDRFWTLLRSLRKRMEEDVPGGIMLEILETTSPETFETIIMQGRLHKNPFAIDDILPSDYHPQLSDTIYEKRANHSTEIMNIVASTMRHARKGDIRLSPRAVKLDGYPLFRPTDPTTHALWEQEARNTFVFEYIQAFLQETAAIVELSQFHGGHPIIRIIEGVEDQKTLETIRKSVQAYNTGLPSDNIVPEESLGIQGFINNGAPRPLPPSSPAYH